MGVTLEGQRFREAVMGFPAHASFPRSYALSFVRYMNDTDLRSSDSSVWSDFSHDWANSEQFSVLTRAGRSSSECSRQESFGDRAEHRFQEFLHNPLGFGRHADAQSQPTGGGQSGANH